MPICKNCGNKFPVRVWIDGKERILSSRKYCLDCSPFGLHNTRQIHLVQKGRLPEEIICKICGRNYIYDPKKGHQKTICNSCNANRKRQRRKQRMVDYLGGRCSKCGYDRCIGALEFHHRDPDKKDMILSGNHCRKWESVKGELDKCDLVCANCHREIHYRGGIA